MEKSEVFQTIVEGLREFEVSENCALSIMLMLKTEEQMDMMLEWIMEVGLDQDRIPTESECLEQAAAITQPVGNRTSSK